MSGTIGKETKEGKLEGFFLDKLRNEWGKQEGLVLDDKKEDGNLEDPVLDKGIKENENKHVKKDESLDLDVEVNEESKQDSKKIEDNLDINEKAEEEDKSLIPDDVMNKILYKLLSKVSKENLEEKKFDKEEVDTKEDGKTGFLSEDLKELNEKEPHQSQTNDRKRVDLNSSEGGINFSDNPKALKKYDFKELQSPANHTESKLNGEDNEQHNTDNVEEEKDGDIDYDKLLKELSDILTKEILTQKLDEIKKLVILPSWKRYKSRVDEVVEVANGLGLFEEDLDDDTEFVYEDFKSKNKPSEPINFSPTQEQLDSLYQTNQESGELVQQLGPDEDSTATMLSGMSFTDLVVPERCEGTSKSINNKCFCTRLKQWSCPAGHFCMAPNFAKPCTLGFYCPANTFQPNFCCGGYYCPTPAEIYICPAGSYCQEGSIKPASCNFGSCPEGSHTIKKYEIFILFVFFLLAVWVAYSLRERQRKLKRAEYDRRFEELSKKDPSSRTSSGSSSNDSSPVLTKEGEGDDSELVLLKKGHKHEYDITFENLGLKLPNGVEIMKGVSGKLHSKRICAIMGPSGAGKTTFVSLLTGKVHRTAGRVLINGKVKELSTFRKLIGFVPQEDVMLRKMTVEEVLMHSAFMRLPVEWSEEMKQSKVLEYIEFLGLRHVMHSVIGDEEDRGISGGQRKRVNIGMELVADPIILFLDEPTSGLDSSTSVEVCTLLNSISRDKGLTVAAVIHSPSPVAFNKFDDLLLLGKGGRVIYHGTREGAYPYFQSIGFQCPIDTAPSDFYMDVATGKVPNPIIPEFQVPDLYTIWELYENSIKADQKLDLQKFIEPRIHLFKLIDESPLSPALSTFSSEDGYSSLELSRTSSYDDDSNGKGKKLPFLSAHILPLIRSINSSIISPILQSTSGLMVDIFSWLSSVYRELMDTLSSFYHYFKGDGNDPIRNTPGPIQVFNLCFSRAMIQLTRPVLGFVSDQLLHLGCGLFLSIAAKKSVFLGPMPDFICSVTTLPLVPRCQRPILDMVANIGNFLAWGIGFAGIAVGSGTYGNDRVVYWREVSSGMPAFPYFLAKSLADIPRILIAALMFTSALVALYPNSASFSDIYFVVLALYYWGFSTGYFISALVSRSKASLVGVVVALFWAIPFSGVSPSLRDIESDWGPNVMWLWDLSAPRWAIAAFYLSETEAKGYMDPSKMGQRFYGYHKDSYASNIINVLTIGLFWQIAAFVSFKLANRDKMQ